MHTLFQALNQGPKTQGSGQTDSDGDQDGSRPGATEQKGRGGIQTLANAQQLLQSLASDSSSTNQNLSALEASFQNLAQALSGGDSANSATQPNLKAFMQSLVQDLGGITPPPSGNLHSSQV